LDGTYTLAARWVLAAKLRGQHAHEPLIPGEQLGIAGTSGVRGFREREVTGDKGYFFNLEAHAPPLFADIGPYVFYDYGTRTLVTPVIGASSKEHIASAGLGLKWRWQRIDLNVSWAHVLNGVANGTPRDHDKMNFSAFYRF
jgi:hemolysin activation/secretion protein